MANQGIDENLEHTRVLRVISDKRENWRRKSDTVHQYNIAADRRRSRCRVTRSYVRRQSNNNNNNYNNNDNNNTLTNIGSNSDNN